MGLFSDIISAVGNVFGGGNSGQSFDNNQDKRKQDNTPQPSNLGASPKISLPTRFNTPQVTPQTPVFNLKPVDNSNLTAGTPQPQPQPNNNGGGFWHTLLHGAENVGEGVAGAGAGLASGVLRAGEGLVSGAEDIPNIVVHAVTKPARMIGGPDNPVTQGLDTLNQQSQRFTNDITQPVNWLAQKTDMIPGMLNHENGTPTIAGRVAADIYKPAQVATNIATVVPAVSAAAAKGASLLGDASKTGGVLNAINNAVRSQSIIPTLSKVPVLGSALNKIPGISEGGEAAVDAGGEPAVEPTPAEPAPVESGVKPVEEAPTNAPAGESAAPPTTPNAPESGVKPVNTLDKNGNVVTPSRQFVAGEGGNTVATEAAPTPAPVQAAQEAAQQAVTKTAETPAAPVPASTATAAESPAQAASVAAAEAPAQQAVVDEAPNVADLLKKTGDSTQDTQNATALVRNLLEKGRDYSGGNTLQNILDLANAHLNSNSIVARILNSRLGDTLTEDEARNVRNAVETGSANGLNEKEIAVFKTIQENIENPANTVRTNLSSDYQQAQNHFPQVRQASIRTAARGASTARGINSKISTFNDLLNRESRFSQASTMGKFTDKTGATVVGDAPDLGLVAKKDGTFVDKNGKVYNYSRATSQELENAGVKIQSPKDALAAYTRDTLNLKTRADAADYLVKNADAMGLSDTQAAGKTTPVTIKSADGEDHNFFTDSKTAKDIRESGLIGDYSKDASLPVRAWNALSSAIAQATVMNPTAHSLNLATNAFVSSGAKGLAEAFKPLDEAAELRMSDAGVHFPTYGKNSANALSKLTHGATKLNERAISAIDKQIRGGMFQKLTDSGMSDKQAAQRINDYLGGRSIYNKGGAQLGIFWKYFVRQNVNAGRILAEAAKGHPQALINAAIAGVATYGADKGLQAATGNKAAYIHAPGVVGIAKDYLKTGEAIAQGQGRQAVAPLVSHVNPLAAQVAEQTLGVNYYGDKFKNGAARVANVLGMTPITNLANDNGHSVGEKVLNTGGVYLPHVKGDMATDNPKLAPVLNVKNAQNGSTVAFPNDFTGEQENKALNDYLASTGAPYSSKTAATFGSQTQDQQKALAAAAKTLKGVGVTNATDIRKFSGLSPDDQKAYVDVVKGLNQAGTAVSSATIEKELVSKGSVELAASLNKNIPDSLTQDDKNILERYAVAGNSGQRQVWLQNNDNAASYYKAAINQKAATNSLTNEDKDTTGVWSGTGNTLAIKSLVAQTNKQFNVSQDLQQLYEDTTKSQYEKMTGPQKDALTQYARQLNGNGVTDKFGIATGTSGGSFSPSKAFHALGIPSSGNSVLMPKAATGLTAGTESYKQPTLQSFKASTATAGNPFARKITASKGVKV